MAAETLRVGEVARRAGVSVRTLHHYHEIGLLEPSGASAGGHRLYTAADLARLQQIRSLQALGFSLREVQDFLDRPGSSPLGVLEMHIARLREQLDEQRAVCERIERVADAMRGEASPSVDDFLQTLEATARLEKYFSPEQRAYLEQRRAEVSDQAMADAEVAWAEVFAGFERAVRDGLSAESVEVRQLVARARGLIAAFSGGDAGVERSLGEMYEREGSETILRPHGFDLDPEVGAFMQKAMSIPD